MSAHQALLIIDMQQGLCEGDGAAFDTDGVIARINTPDAFLRTPAQAKPT